MEIKYDERGGILNTVAEPSPIIKKKGKRGYNFIERFLLKHSRKINYLLDGQGRYKCRQQDYPPVLRIGVTNRCAARCTYCPREYIHAGGSGYMEMDLFRTIVRWCLDHGIKEMGFALWGEPLLHPQILEMIELAAKAGFKMRLSTNGIVLNKELAEKISDYDFEAIEMSMDGFTGKEYLAGKGVDKFNQAKENILYFLDLARRKKSRAIFNIHFVDVGNVSFLNRVRYVRFWRKQLQGLKFMTSFIYEPHNWAGTRDASRRKMGWLDRILGKFELKKPCVYLKGLAINWDGTAYLCSNNPLPSSILGNIKEENIEAIYKKDKRERCLSEHERGSFNCEGCDSCTVNSIFPLLFLKKVLINKIISLF